MDRSVNVIISRHERAILCYNNLGDRHIIARDNASCYGSLRPTLHEQELKVEKSTASQ